MQVAYSKASNLTFNAAYVARTSAAANPIGYNDIFPLGTGAFSYIAAAAYQLQSINMLDVDQPLTNYLDPADFQQSGQWCPQIYSTYPDEDNTTMPDSAQSPTSGERRKFCMYGCENAYLYIIKSTFLARSC